MITRRRLDIGFEPVDVLRRLRGRDRVAALIGEWHQGEALIACDPVEVLADDPFAIDGLDGWLLGAWGYRLGATVERLPDLGSRPVPQPEFRLARYDVVLRLVDGAWFVEHLPDAELSGLLELLAGTDEARPFTVGNFDMHPSAEAHQRSVQKALDHIAAGDIFQVNLCARMDAEFEGDPLDLFCTGVESLAPAYAAFVDSPEGAIVSFSPELFLRRTGDEVLTSPIKGTAPLDSDIAELVASAKNRAENVMIVDLMRNDLGRVSTPGTVRVPALVRPERHAVWHLVSDVVGHAPVPHEALLRATFPPGSVTGAPKVRAMEIAAELEPTSREAYTGAIGHLSPDGTLELNVAIRTFEIAGSRIWLGVGGGVVADSTPEGEYAELLVKARPLIKAIGGTLSSDNLGGRVGAEGSVSRPSAGDLDTSPPGSTRSTEGWGDVDPSRGIFTTLLVLDGEPVDLESHVARLDASVREVYGFTVRAGLEDAIRRKAAGLSGHQRLRVDAVPTADDVDVTLTATAVRSPAPIWRLVPHTVPGGLGAHKWADRDRIPFADPAADPLLLDTDGSVLETGRTNIFLVLDDGVHTPPLDGRILPGTARARVIEQLTAAGIPVLQRRLAVADVEAASEVFVSNTLRGVLPVTDIEGIGTWPAGPVAAALIEGRLHAPPRTERAWPHTPRVLFVDNYDSFVYNLVQYVRELGADADVVRNDARSVEQVVHARERGEFTHVIVSPGPGAPADAGMSVELIRRLGPTTPTLGVCLGHQAIGEAYGAAIVRAPEVVHGKPSLVHHDGKGVYAGLPSPVTCARYHSLIIDEPTLPPELEVTARTASGIVMGVRHRTHPVEGVQMHPESILTTHGHDMLTNFLAQ